MSLLWPSEKAEKAAAKRAAARSARADTRALHLQGQVVKTALRYWRTTMLRPGGGGDAEKFWKACAALEKFEDEN